MIKKFIKKNVKPLDGVELTQFNRAEVLEWLSGAGKEGPDGSIFLKTPESGEGTQIVHTGKFILKGYTEQLGWHFWPVDASYMAENYEQYFGHTLSVDITPKKSFQQKVSEILNRDRT